MTKHSITSLKDYDIAKNGRTVVLNFADDRDTPVSLKMSEIEVEKLAHELEFVITKARQLSDLSKQGIVPFLRPDKSRANLTTQGSTVVVSFVLRTGLVLHYGLEPTEAEALGRQILDAAVQGKNASPLARH
jgi:hypothetical protein